MGAPELGRRRPEAVLQEDLPEPEAWRQAGAGAPALPELWAAEEAHGGLLNLFIKHINQA